MKKILTLSIFLFLSLAINAQEQKPDPYAEFKDYKPCSECFEKWHKSTPNAPRIDLSEPKKGVGTFFKRLGGAVAAVFVATAVTAAVLTTDKTLNEAIH